MGRWRLIQDDGVTASFGLAADEALTHRTGRGESPPTLRLYTYRSHCALVGRFQTTEHEVHVDYCRAHGVAINRRPTGGGAILMGADQLGVALMLPARGDASYGRARAIMARFSQGLVDALGKLGVNAGFRRKNDIEVAGRKIVGLGIYRSPAGGLLFHASLLVDLDIPLMLRVLNTPFEKLSDKAVSTVAGRITTVRRETGRALSLDAVREEVARGYARAFDVALEPGTFTPEELTAIRALEQEKYRTEAWVFQQIDAPDAEGMARLKTPAGLLEARVSLGGRLIKSAWIRGDFFTSENAIADLEGRLRWHSPEPEAIRATVAAVYSRWGDDLRAIPSDALVRVIQNAVRRARVAETRARTDPYGCFVTPGGAYA
jgi:lipoate-protein ligase A